MKLTFSVPSLSRVLEAGGAETGRRGATPLRGVHDAHRSKMAMTRETSGFMASSGMLRNSSTLIVPELSLSSRLNRR